LSEKTGGISQCLDEKKNRLIVEIVIEKTLFEGANVDTNSLEKGEIPKCLSVKTMIYEHE
jgi:hypothetical protein